VHCLKAWLLLGWLVMKLLIVGATGPTGREIVRQALALGHSVTALVRNAAKAGFVSPVHMAVGDVLESAALKDAVVGQDAVICSLGSAISGPVKEMTLLSAGTRNLVAAMQAEGVKRLVCITGVGAGDSKGHGPWYYNWLIQPLMLRGVYHDKTRQEEFVRNSGLDWTLVRPGLLTNGPPLGAGAIRAFTQLAGVYVGSISRADVAAFCLRELAEGCYLRQAPLITI
jgi:putative NADH-flavin reductase